MKKILVVLVFASLCLARLSPIITVIDSEIINRDHPGIQQSRGTLIGPAGDIRAVLGPQGKSIIVCKHGDVIAVIYGDPTPNPTTNPLEVYVAYSTNGGASFSRYGAFSPELRRIYPGVDGSPDFCTNPGELYFVWQESPSGYNTGGAVTMIEENVPSSPSFSTPTPLPGADIVFPWQLCIACAPDSPQHVIASGWSYLNGGNGTIVCWISDDGAYSWTGPIFMGDTLPAANTASPHVRYGTGGYVVATYHNTYNWGGVDIEFPYFIESTDGGLTWSSRVPLPVPYANPNLSQFWWHELDCEVINNEPWTIHGDLGTDSMWLFHGTGNPGNWDWQVFNVRQLGACSLTIADTLFYCYPSQYPSISYEPISNTILISYKAYYLKQTPIETFYDGAHIGGIYSTDNGLTWQISQPLSEPNTGQIAWSDWNATETSHRLVNIDGNAYAYAVWVQDIVFNVYFEKGSIKRFFVPRAIEEYQAGEIATGLSVTPSITRNVCSICFSMTRSGNTSLTLYNACGSKIADLFHGYLQQGNRTVQIRTSDIPAGTYFIVLDTETGKQTAKVIITH